MLQYVKFFYADFIFDGIAHTWFCAPQCNMYSTIKLLIYLTAKNSYNRKRQKILTVTEYGVFKLFKFVWSGSIRKSRILKTVFKLVWYSASASTWFSARFNPKYYNNERWIYSYKKLKNLYDHNFVSLRTKANWDWIENLRICDNIVIKKHSYNI